MAANFPKWVVPLSMPKLQQQERIRIGYASHYLYSYSGTLFIYILIIYILIVVHFG
jgi:hypothetical protein